MEINEFNLEREEAWAGFETMIRIKSVQFIPPGSIDLLVERCRPIFDVCFFETRGKERTFPLFLREHMGTIIGFAMRREILILDLEFKLRERGGDPQIREWDHK